MPIAALALERGEIVHHRVGRTIWQRALCGELQSDEAQDLRYRRVHALEQRLFQSCEEELRTLQVRSLPLFMDRDASVLRRSRCHRSQILRMTRAAATLLE